MGDGHTAKDRGMTKERLNITVESDVYEWVQKKSDKERRTVSNFVEYVLWLAMEADLKKEKK
jgi:hypothetical protein